MEELMTLKRLGLTEYEARVYLALSRIGSSSVSEIASESRVPRNKVYEVLGRLEQQGRVVRLPLMPRKYQAGDPELFKEEIVHMQGAVEQLIKAVQQPAAPEFRELFWVIKGRTAIIERMALENKRCRKEIFGCTELNKPLPKNTRIIAEAVRRGVKVRFITPFDEKHIPVYEDWLAIGVEIRVFDTELFGKAFPRTSIYDGKVARITVGTPEVKREEDYLTLWTESKAFATMLRTQFLDQWKQAKPIGSFLR